MSDVVEGSVEGEVEETAPPEWAATPAPVPPSVVSERRPVGDLVRTQAAAVAATGFAVGAVTAVVLSRRHTRKTVSRSRPGKGKRELANVVASRSFLVDVHLLGPKDR